MKTISRLEAGFPQLAVSFEKAAPSKQLQALADACSISILKTGLEGEDISRALECIKRGKPAEASLSNKLNELVSQYDEEYFQLDESGDHSAINVFSKARAISSLVFGLSMTPEQFGEALYEAMSSVEDPQEIIRAIEPILI